MADDTGTAATADATTDAVATTGPSSQDQLGDGGKAALAAEREARKAEEKARKAAEKAARDAQAKLDELTQASQSDTEKAIEKARKEAAEAARAEVTSAFRTQLLNAEIRAQAAGKFANPELAVKVLDIDVDDVFGNDGIKKDAIAKAVDGFLALDENAGLKADPSNGRPSGDADAGKGFGAAKTPEQAHQEFIASVLSGRAPTR